MPFELPKDFAPRTTELSEATKKVYRGRLNTLAKGEFGNNAEELRENHKKIITHLKTLDDKTELAKMKIRGILTAILWVQPQVFREKSNQFYKYYQKVLPDKVGDKDWVARKNYVAE